MIMENGIEVRSYGELQEFIDMFRKKYIDFVVIKGRAGTGKTHTVKELMENREHLFVNTHISPLEGYIYLYQFRNKPVIIDDIDNLISNDKLVSLFKQCGETVKKKEMEWNTTTPRLGDVPKSFKTTSNLMLISNEINAKGNLNRLALLDRGFCINFNPNKDELLSKMREITRKTKLDGKWKIYNFIKDNFDVSKKVNLRSLVKGFQLKRYGCDWKDILSKEIKIDLRLKEVKELLEKHNNVKDAVEEYSRSRRDFFRKKKELGARVSRI